MSFAISLPQLKHSIWRISCILRYAVWTSRISQETMLYTLESVHPQSTQNYYLTPIVSAENSYLWTLGFNGPPHVPNQFLKQPSTSHLFLPQSIGIFQNHIGEMQKIRHSRHIRVFKNLKHWKSLMSVDLVTIANCISSDIKSNLISELLAYSRKIFFHFGIRSYLLSYFWFQVGFQYSSSLRTVFSHYFNQKIIMKIAFFPF